MTADGRSIVREDLLRAATPMTIASIALAVPSTGDDEHAEADGVSVTGREGQLVVSVSMNGRPAVPAIRATGNSALGKGARGAIPLHLWYEWKNVPLPVTLRTSVG